MAFPRPIDKTKENSARRVVKQGLFCICGMCGSRYGKEAQAEACLKKCIDRYMAQATVVDKAEKSGTVYRCAYCKRVYEKLIQAKECAKTCKSEIQKKIDAEARVKGSQSKDEKLKSLAAFTGGEVSSGEITSRDSGRDTASRDAPPKAKARPPKVQEPPPKKAVSSPRAPAPAAPPPDPTPATPKPVHPAEGTKFGREGNSYQCHSCHQKYHKYQDAIACYDRHREQELAGVTLKKPTDDKFFRDGAKYVCKKCNSKYFSRTEVADCFDGHKEEEEVWVTGGPQGKKAKPEDAPPPKETLEAARSRRALARTDSEKFFRDGAKYVCRICNKKSFTKPEVIQCYDGHAAEEAADAAAAADSGPILTAKDLETASQEKTPSAVKSGRNRDGEDKFYRDGAKYVCKKCNTRHFTRNDVIQCFDKH